MLHHIADALHAKDKILILVIPPKRESWSGPAGFSEENFKKLYQVVDFFSLMTYDYKLVLFYLIMTGVCTCSCWNLLKNSSSGQHGFNAPLRWVKECVEHIDPGELARMKILMGLNFYGRYIENIEEQKVDHILGRDLVKKIAHLDGSTEFDWSSEAHEHYLMYNDAESDQRSAIFYPSLMSINERLQVAKALKVGISIWEVGQGLDYFYDLL